MLHVCIPAVRLRPSGVWESLQQRLGSPQSRYSVGGGVSRGEGVHIDDMSVRVTRSMKQAAPTAGFGAGGSGTLVTRSSNAQNSRRATNRSQQLPRHGWGWEGGEEASERSPRHGATLM